MPAMISWAASHVFRAKLPLVFTGSGSGDKTYDFVLAFCLLVLAVVATAVWSVLDRNGGNYVALNKCFGCSSALRLRDRCWRTAW